VAACVSNKNGSHAAIASLFGVDEATIEELLQRYEETGDVLYKRKGGNHRRVIDLEWLRKDLQDNPGARLIDRIRAWMAHGGKRVSIGSMWMAVRACGWVHQGDRWFPKPEVAPPSWNAQR